MGIDNDKIDFKNDYGEYFFDLKIGSDNTQLTIQSNYRIIKDLIPKEEYKQLKEINRLVKQIYNKRLIIKLNEP